MAEKVDLRDDAIYYCVDARFGAIQKNKVTEIELQKHTLKVKDKNVTFTLNENFKITSLEESVFYLFDTEIHLSAIVGKLNVNLKNGVVIYSMYYTLNQKNGDIHQYISQGTCTKW